ncbi:molybdenum cofactor biosynthesis protein MoeB (plasmid) [Priestia aryabhattai]
MLNSRANQLYDESKHLHYQRQMRLNEVGVLGQKKLSNAKVLIIGAGALGSPNALYLAAAGVGTIGIVDGDKVEASNLHRQILYSYKNIKEYKVESAKDTLTPINPNINIEIYNSYINSSNALDIISKYDLVINGTDNFPTRYLINDACFLLNKPIVDASILRFSGQATVFFPGKGCYRCLFPSPPPPNSVPNCSELGILGPVAGYMGTLQATEALKLILGIGESLVNKLLVYDALKARHLTLKWSRDPNCPLCGDSPSINKLIDYQEFCGVKSENEHSVQDEINKQGWAIDPRNLYYLLLKEEKDVRIIDIRRFEEFKLSHIKNSQHMSVKQLQDKVQLINESTPIYLICKSGEISGITALNLRKLGYRNVFNLTGGINSWMLLEYPVQKK